MNIPTRLEFGDPVVYEREDGVIHRAKAVRTRKTNASIDDDGNAVPATNYRVQLLVETGVHRVAWHGAQGEPDTWKFADEIK